MKLLFFSPHSAIWPHAFPEALVAEALQQSGHQIDYVTCGGLFAAGCIAMSARGVTSNAPADAKEKVCDHCRSCAGLLRNNFALAGNDLVQTSTPDDAARVRKLLATVTRDNFLALHAGDIPIGKFALYEFLIDHKKSALVFDDEGEWLRYRTALENALLAFHTMRRILESVKPDVVVVYNSLYSVNRVVCALAVQRGIPAYSLHAGGNLTHRLQTLVVARGNNFDQMGYAKSSWARFRNLPVEAKSARQIADHFLELLRGRSIFAYSSPHAAINDGLRETFGVDAAQRVLCATLSSPDERFAAETVGVCASLPDVLFPTQAEWVEKLIEHVRQRPDLFLIIRVHPREFPNKREGVKSAHAHRLEATLRDLPSNVAVNWPGDNISLYDLAQITDVFLNAWSSTGKEMAVLGIPVVVYSEDLLFYPADINYLGMTREDYFAQIDKALADGWCYETVRQAFRWYQVEYRPHVDSHRGRLR